MVRWRLLTAALLSAVSISHATAQRSSTLTISVIATSDLHGGVLPRGNRGGLALLGGYVRNVRAAGGLVTIRHGRARACRLVEIPVEERAPILKRYLQKVPGARPHVRLDPDGPLAAFEGIAVRYPAFRVEAATTPTRTPMESGP